MLKSFRIQGVRDEAASVVAEDSTEVAHEMDPGMAHEMGQGTAREMAQGTAHVMIGRHALKAEVASVGEVDFHEADVARVKRHRLPLLQESKLCSSA
jgi:hypothetical protein